MGDATSSDNTPRGSWVPHLDYSILITLDDSACTASADHRDPSQHGCTAPELMPCFDDLALSDIESLEELPGASGRRQCTTYRFGSSRVIKVSPHRSLFYEARVLVYIKQTCPTISVPEVFGVRQLRGATGKHFYCLLMEYIDGVSADEAACEWNVEETQEFMASVQTLQQTLAKSTRQCIQAVTLRQVTCDDYEMSDDTSHNHDNTVGSVSNNDDPDLTVQDELFDHIWQPMDRGPFMAEGDFIKSVGLALQRRGTGASRLDLVCRMVDQLRLSAPTSTETSFPLQHANLSLGNFLVRRTSHSSGGGGTPEIVGVLGWGQCGFYPAWWELAKMAASEDRLLVDMAAQDGAFSQYSQHASVMLHVRDIIY